jgi:hypothetical protein
MSEERKKVLQRFKERLAHLESGAIAGPAHWHLFHLHNALNALPDDHSAADLHLDEFDRADLAKEFPEMEADRPPSASEIRNRFDMLAGGLL